MRFFSETPRYDFSRGQVEEARRTLSSFYGIRQDHPLISNEIALVESKAEAESRGGPRHWSETFTGPSMAHRIILGATLQALQQLTGANYFLYYGNTVFQSTGLDNSYVTQLILGVVNFLHHVWALARQRRIKA